MQNLAASMGLRPELTPSSRLPPAAAAGHRDTEHDPQSDAHMSAGASATYGRTSCAAAKARLDGSLQLVNMAEAEDDGRHSPHPPAAAADAERDAEEIDALDALGALADFAT